ncbi:MAG: hypothetical protein MSS77_02465 [Mollicutes bacterium]|nr:hypothetical protein [Mollicutes bacterium]
MNKETLNIILTIIFLTIVLGIIIFLIYDHLSNFKKKLDKNLYDYQFKKDLDKKVVTLKDNRNRVYRYNKLNGLNVTIDSTYFGNNEYDSPTVNVKQYSLKPPKQKKEHKVLRNIIDGVFIVIFIALIGFNVYTKINGDLISINNTSYITLASGSMSYKNERNTYLEENDINNQLKTFTLIGLNKVNENTALSLYDICAYKDKETNQLIVHRIINIEDRNGTTYYTFRGDANESSDYYLVSRSEILYIFNGYASYPLGLIVSFINSYVGLAVILYIAITIIVLNRVYLEKDKLYNEKIKEAVTRLNNEEITKLGNTKYIDLSTK